MDETTKEEIAQRTANLIMKNVLKTAFFCFIGWLVISNFGLILILIGLPGAYALQILKISKMVDGGLVDIILANFLFYGGIYASYNEIKEWKEEKEFLKNMTEEERAKYLESKKIIQEEEEEIIKTESRTSNNNEEQSKATLNFFFIFFTWGIGISLGLTIIFAILINIL